MERGGICTKQSTVSCAGHLAIPATSLLAAVQLRCKLQVPVTDRQTSAAPMFGGQTVAGQIIMSQFQTLP
jgi:hypothetical protein